MLLNNIQLKNKILKIENSQYNNTFLIYVQILDMCNYTCKYCCSIDKKNNINLNELIIFLKSVYEKINKNIVLIILGGEPTLHPKLYEFCEKLNKLDYISNIKIHSNFSQDVYYYDRFLNSFDKLDFIFSWHSNKDNNIQFYYKALKLKEQLTVKKIYRQQSFIIMYEHENINISCLLYKLFKQKKFDVELGLIDVTIRQNIKNRYYYTNSQIKKALKLVKQYEQYDKNIKITFENKCICYISDFEYSYLVYNNYFKDFFNWNCLAGQQSIYISSNGNVYPCIDLYSYNTDYVNSYNIVDGYKQLYCNNITCKQCGSMMISKYKNV